MDSKQQQQQNRYAHLVGGQQASQQPTSGKSQRHPTTVFTDGQGNHRAQVNLVGQQQQQQQPAHPNGACNKGKAPPLGSSASERGGGGGGGGQQGPTNYYYNSFSGVDWRQQWRLMKSKLMDEVEEPQVQRKLILVIVCCALLLDNMLYMVIVPIIPDYLRSIGAWSTYTENAKWIRRNSSAGGQPKWERVGGQVVYEGEDSAVGFLFASKAIVQLFVNPFSGHIIDRIGYEIPMMIGLIVMFFSTMVFACGQTYSVLFLARSLQGVGSAFADTAGLAMIADRFTEENERQRALGVALAFISFGCLVAPPFGSVLYEAAGKEVPFIILSLVCLLDGSLLLLVTPPGTFQQVLPNYIPPPAPRTQTRTQEHFEQQQQQQQRLATSGSQSSRAPSEPGAGGQRDDHDHEGAERRRALQRQKSISRRQSMTVASAGEAPKGTPIYVLFRDPCIACCSGALIVANVSLAFLEPTISIWVQNTMPDIEEWQLGMIWLPAFVPHVLGVYCTIKLADKYPRYQWLIAAIGLILEGLSCMMVPFCSSFWSLIIPISIICFGLALIDTAILPTLGFLVDTRYVSVYGSIYAIADISYSLSYAIGPIIAGGIVEAIGFTALNFLIAIVILGYAPILMMLRSIHDYEPFEADQSGLKHKQAKELAPFGKFGRAPLEPDHSDAEDREACLGGPSGAQQPPARWSGSQQPQRSTLSKKPSLKSPAGGGGAGAGESSSSTAVRKQHSVKIVELASVDDRRRFEPAAGAHSSQSPPPPELTPVNPASRNPFLPEQQQQQQQPPPW